MATIKQCDLCNAMFRHKSPGSASMSGVVYDQYEDGSPHESTFGGDICTQCTAKVTGRPAPKEDTRLMLTSAAQQETQDKTRDLEQWNQGYEAARQTFAGASPYRPVYGDEGTHTHDATP